METYGSGTYGEGTYGAGGTGDLGGAATITITGSLELGGGGALAGAATINIDGALSLGGGSTDLGGVATITITGSLDLTVTKPLWFKPATIRIGASLDLPPRGTRRRIVIVNPDGSSPRELENAVLGPLTWALNKPDEFTFTLGADDPDAALLYADQFQEVQVWRGDQLLTWGPIIKPTQNSTTGVITVTCRDCMWYFARRHIGKAERTNYMVNPSIEDGLAAWNIGFAAPAEYGTEGAKPTYVLKEPSTTRAVSGRYSARTETPNDTYPLLGAVAFQNFFWQVDAAAKDGDQWSASVWIYIPSATLRSLNGAAMGLVRYDPDDLIPAYNLNGDFVGNFPNQIERVTAPITPDFPLDKWHKLEVNLLVPPTGELEIVQLEISLPKGVLFFDDARVTYNERLEFFATDQATIAAAIVEHLQDPAFDKSDLNIATHCPPTGVLRDATYLHEEHLNGLRALEDFTRLDDGFDHRIEYTATTRTYTLDYPASGRYRPRLPLRLAAEIGRFSWTFDGELAASAVVTLGQGGGSGRVEGFASDPNAYANGLTLEEVFAAPPGAPVASLDNLAAERLAVTTSPEILEFTTLPDAQLTSRILGGCRKGDVLEVTIRRGHLAIEGTRWRLVRLTLNPDDSLSGTLNRRDVTA